MAKKDVRFHVTKVSDDCFGAEAQIWVDKQTGVNYLYIQAGYSGGLTPLLNRDGTLVITTVPREYDE